MYKINSILDLVNPNDYCDHLDDKMKEDVEYKKYEEEFHSLVETLDKKIEIKIDGAAVAMETRAMSIAFLEGFNTAVKLIFSLLSRWGGV